MTATYMHLSSFKTQKSYSLKSKHLLKSVKIFAEKDGFQIPHGCSMNLTPPFTEIYQQTLYLWFKSVIFHATYLQSPLYIVLTKRQHQKMDPEFIDKKHKEEFTVLKMQ